MALCALIVLDDDADRAPSRSRTLVNWLFVLGLALGWGVVFLGAAGWL